jgi:protein TonB
MFQPSKLDTYALNKDNYISISVDLIPVKNKATKKKTTTTPVETASDVLSEDVDVNDLFSDVWTKKITKKKPKARDKRRIEQIQKKIKTSEENKVQSLSQKVQSLDSSKNNDENSAASTASEVNEYLAKIQAIVYNHFQVPANSQGHSVKAVIELNALGKVLDFRILSYSSNEALNAEADKIKERLKKVVFPINPQNKSSRTIVILKSKE